MASTTHFGMLCQSSGRIFFSASFKMAAEFASCCDSKRTEGLEQVLLTSVISFLLGVFIDGNLARNGLSFSSKRTGFLVLKVLVLGKGL